MSDELDIFEDEEAGSIFTLLDAQGRECRFQLLDMIEYNSRDYIVLLSEEEAAQADCDVDILEVVPDEDNPELESYLPVEDDAVIDQLFELFRQRNEHIFDFV